MPRLCSLVNSEHTGSADLRRAGRDASPLEEVPGWGAQNGDGFSWCPQAGPCQDLLERSQLVGRW
jgi:hypothetical protein